jgi:type IV pilus assembly protein PilV
MHMRCCYSPSCARAGGRAFGAKSRGFSLVEVMVAVIVLSVGLLGIAKMQALSLSSTTIANKRSLAAIEAAGFAAAMHENRGYWTKSDASGATITITGATISVAQGPNLAASVAAPPSCVLPALPCSVTDLAAYDLKVWADALTLLLPNDVATITCGAVSPVTCTIKITWSENAVAVNSQEATVLANNLANGVTAAIQKPDYTLYVEP